MGPGVRVGARHIRAPEVVLGLNWCALADMWSLGCMLASLYTGERLFKVHADAEHLATIERILQVRVPVHMVLNVCPKVAAKGLFFDQSGRVVWPDKFACSEAVEKIRSLKPLNTEILPRHRPFWELLRGLLAVNPDDRVGA